MIGLALLGNHQLTAPPRSPARLLSAAARATAAAPPPPRGRARVSARGSEPKKAPQCSHTLFSSASAGFSPRRAPVISFFFRVVADKMLPGGWCTLAGRMCVRMGSCCAVGPVHYSDMWHLNRTSRALLAAARLSRSQPLVGRSEHLCPIRFRY
jgi:hypothetical protein